MVRATYGDSVKIGAGNVVDAEGFQDLAEAGADFIKIAGSICITREQKGTISWPGNSDVARARVPTVYSNLTVEGSSHDLALGRALTS